METVGAQGTAYLIIEGERNRYTRIDPITGLKPVTKTKIVGVRQTRPRTLDQDQVVVKVTIQIPATAFDPINPEALIVVPSDLIMRDVIEVEAVEETA